MLEHVDVVSVMYIGGGLILPMYYVPQIRRFAHDRSALESFSITKTVVQCFLRLLMLPFVLRVGNELMSAIVLLDTFGRVVELTAALWSLRRQGWSWVKIAERVLPGWAWNFALYSRALFNATVAAVAGSKFVLPVIKKFAPPALISKDHAAWVASAHTSRHMEGSAFVGLDPRPVSIESTVAAADSRFPA